MAASGLKTERLSQSEQMKSFSSSFSRASLKQKRFAKCMGELKRRFYYDDEHFAIDYVRRA